MRRKKIGFDVTTVLVISAITAVGFHWHRSQSAQLMQLDAGSLPAIGKVDSRFLSYNIEMEAITGGPFWKPYSNVGRSRRPDANSSVPAGLSRSKFAYRPPLDLANRRLLALAKALGPAYLRVSGTWANSVYFQDNDKPAMAKAPAGFSDVLTRAEWRGVIDFAQAVNAKILTSFTISAGVRNAAGTWTPREAGPLLQYTHSIGGDIYAAELFNEPNLSGYGGGPKKYDASWFARDEAAFRAFAAKAAPDMKIAGPGDVVTDNIPIPGAPTAQELMTAAPRAEFDIVSYHFYPAISQRCAPSSSPIGARRGQALTEAWLARTDESFEEHEALRDRYAPGAPIWLTETGGAACGGAPWDARYLDTFRFIDQMGRLAKQGVSVVFNQTFVSGDYGIVDPTTYAPRPSYWAALLWRRLMGTTVLDAGPIHPGLHVYAQCLRGKPGGVSILAINLTKAHASLDLSAPADLYALTAPKLESSTVLLNGHRLAVGPGNRIPAFGPRVLRTGRIALGPTSIDFIALPDANNPNCL